MVVYLFAVIVWGIIWGIVVNNVIQNKGYEENWFWWGFFFCFFALIVALTKPVVDNDEIEEKPFLQTGVQKKKEMIANGESDEKVDVYSSVHILSWDIQKEDSEFFLRVKFLNVSDSIISAILFLVTGFNAFGDRISVNGGEGFEMIGQDISVLPGQSGVVQIGLPNADIRKVDIKVKKVCFSDGKIEESSISKWIDTNQEVLPDKYADCVKRKNGKGKYYAILGNCYWQCVCGFVNTGNVCRVCDMRKDRALLFTKDSIEDTYKQYLDILDEEEKAVEERQIELEKRHEEEKIAEQKKKKKNIKIGIAAACILAAVCVGGSVFNNVSKEKKYEEEKIAISEHISNEAYDSAFHVMIASDSYDELKKEYGSVLWEKQAEMDETFKANSWVFTRNEEDMVYNEKLARNKVCYYEFKEQDDHGENCYLYAVSEDGNKHEVYAHSSYDDEYFYIMGLERDPSGENLFGSMWSKDWLLITAIGSDLTPSSAHLYAVKYNKERDQAYKVELSDDAENTYGFAKMKDGNIIISTQTIDQLTEADEIKLFDVVKGTVNELTYDKLEKKYEGDISGNIITVFE